MKLNKIKILVEDTEKTLVKLTDVAKELKIIEAKFEAIWEETEDDNIAWGCGVMMTKISSFVNDIAIEMKDNF